MLGRRRTVPMYKMSTNVLKLVVNKHRKIASPEWLARCQRELTKRQNAGQSRPS